MHDAIEKFSVVKALQAIEQAHVVIGVLDAHDTVAEQDASLLGMAGRPGSALVVAVNKWDGIAGSARADPCRPRSALDFMAFAPVLFISARHGTGVGELVDSVNSAYRAAMREIATPELTRRWSRPSRCTNRRWCGAAASSCATRTRAAESAVVVIHGNQTEHVPDAYRRYLENYFRKRFRLKGTPMRIEFRTDDNPFAGRRNELTPRQQRKRKRLVRHLKGKGR